MGWDGMDGMGNHHSPCIYMSAVLVLKMRTDRPSLREQRAAAKDTDSPPVSFPPKPPPVRGHFTTT